jgi:hypothetical protein
MSKVKNPKEKKRLSLQRDRRNQVTENSKASRKNIPRSRQRRHMNERRKITQVLTQLVAPVEDDVALAAEQEINSVVAHSRSRGFEKIRDLPLGEMIARKIAKRQQKKT